jgi:hypothetical protein
MTSVFPITVRWAKTALVGKNLTTTTRFRQKKLRREIAQATAISVLFGTDAVFSLYWYAACFC